MSPSAGSSARRAGHDWERALSRRWGVPTTRNTRPGVHDDGGDMLLPGWYVEAKNCATWRVAPWFHLAEQNATPDQSIALVLKRRHMSEGDALVVITLDSFDRLRTTFERNRDRIRELEEALETARYAAMWEPQHD